MSTPPDPIDHDLVSYGNPPVQEVALAVQFSSQIVDLEVFASFSGAVREELPRREYQPPLPPMEELFDMPREAPDFQFAFDASFALPRAWLISGDGTWLVQLQADRLTVNWRRLDAGGEYPRYSEVRRRLVRFLDVLAGCLGEVGIATMSSNFVEVTYVNSITDESNTSRHPHVAGFLRDVRAWRGHRFLPIPEDMQARARWRISDDDGKPVGRLYLTLSPGFRPADDGKMTPIYMLNLTSRVIPSEDDRASALEALDLGHRWCALGFDDLTTPAMHGVWEKRGGGD